MKVKPDLSFWKLWNISFGFFGVQIGTYYLVVAFLFSLQPSGQNAESAFTYFLAMLLHGSQLRAYCMPANWSA